MVCLQRSGGGGGWGSWGSWGKGLISTAAHSVSTFAGKIFSFPTINSFKIVSHVHVCQSWDIS